MDPARPGNRCSSRDRQAKIIARTAWLGCSAVPCWPDRLTFVTSFVAGPGLVSAAGW